VSSFTDTDPETAEAQLALLRSASPARRLRLALSLSRSVIELSRAGLRRRMPEASGAELDLRFVALHYGAELANELREQLVSRAR
jgi:hypothetical protein